MIRPSTCLSVCLPVCLSVCLSVCLLVCLCVFLSACVCLSFFLSVCLSFCLSVCLPVCLSVCLCVCVSVCLCVCLSVCLSVCLCACLSFCLPVCLCLSCLLQPSRPFNAEYFQIFSFSLLKETLGETRWWHRFAYGSHESSRQYRRNHDPSKLLPTCSRNKVSRSVIENIFQ